MKEYPIGIISDNPAQDITFCDRKLFMPIVTHSLEQLVVSNFVDSIRLVVIDQSGDSNHDNTFYREIKDHFLPLGVPIVLLVSDEITLTKKIEALESGFRDVINIDESRDEISTRLLSEIYHQVADLELKSTVQQANDVAFAAMRESSNLGNNIQFLLKAHDCEDLDQLGQVFFQTIEQYNLNCSLQMRSEFGVRNMEANGMARALESKLLTKLQDQGRYVDFDQRSVVNYGLVSVLVRNMPEDENLYGMIKDNTFTLLQGMDARVRALDEHRQLEEEKETLESLSQSVTGVMKGIEADFHTVMMRIVDVVEGMAENIESKVPTLLLNEEQEAYVLKVVENCVMESNQVFAEGLHVDEHFGGLISDMQEVIKRSAKVTQQQQQKKAEQFAQNTAVGSDVELF